MKIKVRSIVGNDCSKIRNRVFKGVSRRNIYIQFIHRLTKNNML